MLKKENIDCIIKELKELQSLAEALAVCSPVPPSLLQLIKDKALHIAAGSDKALYAIENKDANQKDQFSPEENVQQKEKMESPPVPPEQIKVEAADDSFLEKEEVEPVSESNPAEQRSDKEETTQKGVDLTKSMTLNERFRFLRNLFGGNETLMYSTLEDLGRISDLNEMRQYLTDRFQWDWESEPVLDFLQFLEKRIN